MKTLDQIKKLQKMLRDQMRSQFPRHKKAKEEKKGKKN